MIQLYADRIQKEANGKWKTALESRSNRAELEKKLCTAQGKNSIISFSQAVVYSFVFD